MSSVMVYQKASNGAGSDRSRKDRGSGGARNHGTGFNGAGSDRSRKGVTPLLGRHPNFCFNGAGSDRSRKVGITGNCPCAHLASMGPGVIAPGKPIRAC